MYSKLPNLVIGFHGCDISTYNKVLYDHESLKKSNNEYDWLGNGVYFWENNYQRAFKWAYTNSKRKGSSIKEPAVIGAIIDLGNCLNLTDNRSIDVIKKGYEILKLKCNLLDKKMPENRNVGGNTDLLLRHLDCAVIQQIHDYNVVSDKPMYDSVRGIFVEGKEIYPNSGFREKTHVQICIVNPNCIKGYFNPLEPDTEYEMP